MDLTCLIESTCSQVYVAFVPSSSANRGITFNAQVIPVILKVHDPRGTKVLCSGHTGIGNQSAKLVSSVSLWVSIETFPPHACMGFMIKKYSY